ncbi:NAD(P)-binding domain-containing protein [Allostreptomyces psammosilenae]|uniref:Cation diffusion facilitator CzcD-associated flavoprotein CzcO n=1 Tax=Allostreptomyces psammosilenae TaxID=1892865 RepID=A0A852ZWU9_9ACTN|nr:NAD(P)-binding domain-containing protein [Allostreptomyces psammosilenae]NYI06873.1 cation diffusion facilitator CzcD-associated flavoprotein CzcO [Allostreptomyces psammosilenae]
MATSIPQQLAGATDTARATATVDADADAAAVAAPSRAVDVVVVGAGQAGLSAAHHLGRLGVAARADSTPVADPARDAGAAGVGGFVVLDGDDGPGGAWRHRWPTLRLDKAHRIHDLPGLTLAEAVPDADPGTPAAEVMTRYFAAYERRFALPVRRPVRVGAVREAGDGRLLVETDTDGVWSTRALVNATGTWTSPFIPFYPGMSEFRGRQLHTVDYRTPDEFAGQHVVVVGGGASATQLLAEISEVAGGTTWVTRRPPVFNEGPFDELAGREAVARVERAVRAGRPPASVVSVTGLVMTPVLLAARERGALRRQPMFQRLVADGVVWADGRHQRADAILWATGFRAALDHLAPLGLRGPGGGIAMDGTRVAADPRVHLVGYGPSASTIGANRAGREAARAIVRWLAG